MPSTLTPLRYPGGKSKYSKLFIDIITMNELDNCTFVEIFAGGAGAAIYLLLKGYVKSLILNDLDVAIYAFWKSIKESPEDFISKIKSTRISMAEWHRQKYVFDQKNTNDLLALGFATFYLNRCNHSGILNARPIGGMKQQGDYRIGSRYTKTTSIAKIKDIAKYADAIEIFNMDGESLLKHLNQEYNQKKLFIYLDPPYRQKGPALYLNHFDQNKHLSLKKSIMNCQHPWMLSYDNHKEIIDLYSDSNCKLYLNSIRHTITGNSIADELIISKLDLPKELKPLNLRQRSCA